MASKVTPKDFFLWLGGVVSLYGSLAAFITLTFDYINRTFPDLLAGSGDPYASGVRVAMAALIVLVPILITLMIFIRRSIAAEVGKADIWVRKWAIVLTLFLAGAMIAIDLITLITLFLGGEVTTRFLLKVAIVLLVATAVFMHFLAEQKGYWLEYPKKARLVAGAVALVAVLTVAAGFLIVGTPQAMRGMRFDADRVNALQNIQWQIGEEFRKNQTVPANLSFMTDEISGMQEPRDPETNASYEYEKLSDTSFRLCATFSEPSSDMEGKGSYGRDIGMAYPVGGGMDENWKHDAGRTCYTRTIDPAKYQPYDKELR